MNKNFKELLHQARQVKIVEAISKLLDWDQETYMPVGSAQFRGEQLKLLAGLSHKEKTKGPFAKSLQKCIDIKSGKILISSVTKEEKSDLENWRRDFVKAIALPQSFVEEFAQTTSQAINVWRVAKQKSAFALFAPYLDKIVSLNRKKADYLGYKNHPYDALLDEFEPELTTAKVGKLFGGIKKSVVPLVQKLRKQKIDDSFIKGKFSHEKQLAFGKHILEAMGYDFNYGRLDLSSHPFSTSPHPTDSRVTTRIHPTSLISNIAVCLHEGGHSLYEMGLPQEKYGAPSGEALSLGIHESQSRFWETRIGLSKPFWSHFYPLLQKQFPALQKKDLSTFLKAINKVCPSFIRVEADEVTYSLHVILRFEIEKALIEGSLAIRDLPEMWRSKMKELLGITPPDDKNGCLQDIHWPMGAFGYFPTYTIGNLYAAHLFEGFEKQNPKWKAKVASGDLLFIKEWLAQNVYQFGRSKTAEQLLKDATGAPFSEKAYLKYLQEKY